MVGVGIAIATAGIIVGAVGSTGLKYKFNYSNRVYC
jgi:TRAP-type uncharacterized transport system fused permease subunit